MQNNIYGEFDRIIALVQEIFADFKKRTELIPPLIKMPSWPVESLNMFLRILERHKSAIDQEEAAIKGHERGKVHMQAEIQQNRETIRELMERGVLSNKGRKERKRLEDENKKIEKRIQREEQAIANLKKEVDKKVEKIRDGCFAELSEKIAEQLPYAHERQIGLESMEAQKRRPLIAVRLKYRKLTEMDTQLELENMPLLEKRNKLLRELEENNDKKRELSGRLEGIVINEGRQSPSAIKIRAEITVLNGWNNKLSLEIANIENSGDIGRILKIGRRLRDLRRLIRKLEERLS